METRLRKWMERIQNIARVSFHILRVKTLIFTTSKASQAKHEPDEWDVIP